MTWKKINISDAGTGSKFGGNDMDKISDAFSGTDVDDIDMNCDFTARDNKLHYRNPANTFSYNVRTSAILANRDVIEPLLTTNDTRVYQSHTATLINKTIDIRDNPLKLRDYTWLIFKDGSTYYARNNVTGTLSSNSDFKTLFQAVIDTITEKDDTVRTSIKIAPGDYDVNSNINMDNVWNVSIEGSGMGVTRIRAGPSLADGVTMWNINGGVSGTSKSLTANATAKSKTITMSSGDASTFAVGDWVLVRSTAQFFGTGLSKKGELKQIFGIAGGVITFREPLYDSYATADSASAIKMHPMKNTTMRNFTIDRHPSYVGGGDPFWYSWKFCDRVLIDSVEVVDFPGTFAGAMHLRSCTNVKINNCHFQLNIPYNFQYGISIAACCQDVVVTNCTAQGDWRHPFEAGDGSSSLDCEGPTRNIRFSNCVAHGGTQAQFDSHPDGEGITFDGCGVLGTHDGAAFKHRSKNSSIINCWARDCVPTTETSVIKISDGASNCTVQGCNLINCAGSGIGIDDGLDDILIDNNIIDGQTDRGIFTFTTGSDRLRISNNTIRNSGGDAIDLTDVDGSMIVNNMIHNNTGWGIDFQAGTCTDNLVVGNFFANNTAGAVRNGAQTGNLEANNKGY